MKLISIFGSTGSIGTSTLDNIRQHPDKFSLDTLVAYKNKDLLIKQALEFQPKLVVIGDEACYAPVKEALAQTKIMVAAGHSALIEAAKRPVDIMVSAIVGMAGLRPTFEAAKAGVTIALANKESLVASGQILLSEIQKNKAHILPVDSEHNAIFQVFEERNRQKIQKLILTASGGPFRTSSYEEIASATVEQALKHPNWSMGSKVTIDSATLMNKGLELIEASYLFDIEEENIDIVIHPQSIIHSLVAYTDGSVLAQMGVPDMRTPISYCLGWPERICTQVLSLDLVKIQSLTFESPDLKKFPALSLARQSLREGQDRPTVLNAANEVAVQAFLEKKLSFLGISHVVEKVLENRPTTPINTLEDVFNIDAHTRAYTQSLIIT
jgi:1-deoxy-D-xylulose-5-phosphate reductoisomerase